MTEALQAKAVQAKVLAAQSTNLASSTPDTMEWDSRARRMVMIYLPLSCFVRDPVVSVLLDGDHVVQAECGTAELQGT